MIVNNKKAILTGLILGLIGCFVTWILNSEASPFREYFLWHVTGPNFWLNVNIVAVLIALATGVPGMAYLTIFIQWFLTGVFFAWIVGRIRTGQSENK